MMNENDQVDQAAQDQADHDSMIESVRDREVGVSSSLVSIEPNVLDDLRRLAEKATPGEWTAYSHEDPPWLVSVGGDMLDCIAQTVHGNDEANARYIAAVNPVAIVRLLDLIVELQKPS